MRELPPDPSLEMIPRQLVYLCSTATQNPKSATEMPQAGTKLAERWVNHQSNGNRENETTKRKDQSGVTYHK